MSSMINGDSVTGINNVDTITKGSVPATLTGSSNATDHRYTLKIPGANFVRAVSDFSAFWLACYSKAQTVSAVAADFAALSSETGDPCTFFHSEAVGTAGGVMEVGPFEEPITEIWVVSAGFGAADITISAAQSSERE